MTRKDLHNLKHTPFDYDQIDKNIFIGTNVCCQVHFKKELLKKGIKTDISLEEERLDSPFGVDYFLWLPTKDKNAPTEKQLELGINMLTKLVDIGEKVYVHCKNGHGRGPTLVAGYYKSRGLSVKGAIAKIKKKRSTIHLEDIQVETLNNL